MAALIDTEKMVAHFRERILDIEGRAVILGVVGDSQQSKDLHVPPNCDGLGRIHHFHRQLDAAWPANPLPLDPACRALGLPQQDMVQAQVFQVAGCPWRCWYCYVPENLLSANQQDTRWVSATELVDLYVSQASKPQIIDLSGGAPDLVPEWTIWVMEELLKRGLQDEVYLWSDDALSADYLWTSLTDSERERLVGFRNYGHVGCFKGFSPEAFAFNTRAEASGFHKQFERFGRLIDLGLDLYAYVTLTAETDADLESAIPRFMDRLQTLHQNLPLRTAPLQIMEFTPVTPRLNTARQNALSIQKHAVAVWSRELETRFSSKMRSVNVADVPMRDT